ncbi:hypothetical protein KEQ90_25105 [Escherichia coli]|uniref:hypothetical protein n=1 Tax=Escherichia coli TaxID=562 RepID=UPI00079FE924|nr:hypothetical protein [Escherichia coli]EEC9776611.1 hypothetical protein [Escherichia coli]EED1845844.1 hypothetical protein [Escherichia coli]EEQ3308347.1 hypothetical protein [Escherichia coli]EEQ5789223.1 hypothetical protein [Escherichia coli]EEQ7292612.1 hypothetical protein [Escherichia coli]
MTMLVYGVKTATEMLILYVMLILFPEHPVDVNNFQIFGSESLDISIYATVDVFCGAWQCD